MYKSSPRRIRSNQNKKKTLILIALCLILAICFIFLKIMYNRQNITLQNTWQSTETGQILSFNVDGSVDIKGKSLNSVYHIISPNRMEYTVDGKTFQMTYRIEDTTLYWGLSEMSLERFELITNPFYHLI